MASSKTHLPYKRTHKTLLALLLISSLSLALAETPISDPPTVYQLLQSFNFPIGVLPEGVQSYQLSQDGSFEVLLGGDCEFKVQGYLLRYKRRITGTVDTGHLRELNGVSVKVLFAWFGISEVVSSADELTFYVGLLSASLPLSNFEDCPRCSCGFDCSAAQISDS